MNERWVEIDELFNFRDVGGFGGVRRGLLYRTDALCNLTDRGREAYAALGIHTVIDLRRAPELETQGRAPDWAFEVWHNVPLRERPGPEHDCPDRASLPGYISDVYLNMTETAAEDIVRVLTILADPATGPAAIHCAGGRDRTGVVVAVFLALLGVQDNEIALDYHLSERFTERWLAWKAAESGSLPVLPLNLRYTPEQAMLLLLKRLRERHGSVGGYLLDAGLEPAAVEALRARFL
ncbi:MAG TPA: tyrosine-protein phosphatase [Candidatus Limnocylindrales bacterium]|nr:tyrosine-protein phosphatase [Candidatus Limnocylindrales bacterium]